LNVLFVTPVPEYDPPAGFPPDKLKLGSVLQTVLKAAKVTVGVFPIEIVNVTGEPEQLFNVGVTIIVAVPIEVGVNEAMFPEPEAAKPIAEFEFTQSKVEELVPVKLIAVTDEPIQIP
jgi:hypothetical protein